MTGIISSIPRDKGPALERGELRAHLITEYPFALRPAAGLWICWKSLPRLYRMRSMASCSVVGAIPWQNFKDFRASLRILDHEASNSVEEVGGDVAKLFVRNGHCLPRVDGSIAKSGSQRRGAEEVATGGTTSAQEELLSPRLSHRLATDHELESRAREVVQATPHRVTF